MELNAIFTVTIFAVVLVLPFFVHYIRFSLLEKKTIKRLLNFDTVEEGLKSLGIAEEMVEKLQENNDGLYATRIYLIGVKPIKRKLTLMGYTERKNDGT